MTPPQFGAKSPAQRRTKIVASLGAASANAATIEGMIRAGADVFRIDFAKGAHEAHAQTVATVRAVTRRLEASGELKRPIRMMADLQGPRIAVGKLPSGEVSQTLDKGDTVQLGASENDAGVIPVTYPDLIGALKPGNHLLIDDAHLILQVTEAASAANNHHAGAKVLKGGALKPGMLFNVPDVELSTPALMPKDKDDLKFALDHGFEIITQSFPSSAEDINETRQLIRQWSSHNPMLIAKIERPQTVEPKTLRAMAKAADALMVARGDLGTEMGLVKLPKLQQQIIDASHRAGRQVVVANKLLGSMTNSDQPSRSDVFDTANAVQSGADMIMLTTETASGQYPAEAVEKAREIIEEYEPDALRHHPVQALRQVVLSFVTRLRQPR